MTKREAYCIALGEVAKAATNLAQVARSCSPHARETADYERLFEAHERVAEFLMNKAYRMGGKKP